MDLRFSRFLLFCFFLFCAVLSEAQPKRPGGDKSKYKYFQIPGKVKVESGDTEGTTVNLINLETKQTEKSITVTSAGKFDFDLNYFKEYRISVVKVGYYPKDIDVSTLVPPNVWEKDSIFPPFYIIVSLFKKVEGVKMSFEGSVVGKIYYSPNGKLDNFDSISFIDDQAIENEIKNALKSIADQKFNQKIAEALEFEKKAEYSPAIFAYGEALKIKPKDKFVIEKLKELAEDMKNQSAEAKLKAEFQRLLALGDAQVSAVKYVDAIQSYKAALKLIANEPIALQKLAEAERLLAQALDQEKQNAAFDKLIAAGDAQVKIIKYAEGIVNFKDALLIRPNDAATLARIADAERLLAQSLDQQKQNAAFDKLIAAGDAQVKVTKYAEGIVNFKEALLLRPNDAATLARIADAERLLAQSLDQQKQNAAFDKLIAAGDAQVKVTKYAEGIVSFQDALLIRPNDAGTLARIAAAERLLAQSLDKQKQNAAFDKLIATGDSQVKSANYAEGIASFQDALLIRPNDAPTLARIANAEKNLTSLLTEQNKQRLYQQVLKEADDQYKAKNWLLSLAAYQKASAILPNEAYPPKRILELNSIISLENATNRQYQEAIQKGAERYAGKQYSEAIAAYREAQKIKPAEQLPPTKIKEIQMILDGLVASKLAVKKPAPIVLKDDGTDDLYLEKKRLADENFKNAQWKVARFYYLEAYNIKSGEKYIQNRIEECDKMIDSAISAEVIKVYKSALESAELQMKSQNYSSARFYYRKANELIKWEPYPIERLNAIDKLLTEMLSLSDQRAFSENLKKADAAFAQKEYPSAKFYYNKARLISETDQVVARLKEIDSIVNGFEDQKNNSTYSNLIEKGDAALRQNNKSEARFYYEKASQVKPDEKYPKDQIKLIDSKSAR